MQASVLFFPLLQMAFDPADVETAGKTQLKESYKDIFPRSLL